jgi:secreted trypsin-like serine protease
MAMSAMLSPAGAAQAAPHAPPHVRAQDAARSRQPRAQGAARAPQRERARAAVIGGQSAQPGTFPWMAYVLDFRGGEVGQCTGTVVAPNLVLTAGHCAEEMQTGAVNEASGYRVTTGGVNWAAPEADEQVSGVSRVIVCSCFDRHTLVGDAALLQLSTPTSAPAVTLASSPPGATAALLAGWGKTYFAQQAPVQQLQWAPTIVQRPQWCEGEASLFSAAGDVCAIDPPAHRTGACEGDSGGPLLVAEPAAPGGLAQIGVASHVYGNCATTRPSVFTRVDAISAWVRGWAQALASSPPASASLPSSLVPAPVLPGIASARSLSFRGGAISLVLACDSEGGVCNGEAEASIKVRERLTALRAGRRMTVSARTLKVALATVVFGLAPGASVTSRSLLSAQSRQLLSRLGAGPLDVLLSGRGLARHVVSLKLSSRVGGAARGGG